MRIRRRFAVIIALAAAGALAVAGIAIAATTSTFSFKFSPATAPKQTYKAGSLFTDLETHYTNPGNAVPGGAVERTQIYLDKNFKINPGAAGKCAASKLSNQTMKGAMANCKSALVGTGTAQATANGAFNVNGCVLLFNGQPKNNHPTLNVFTRVQASNPSNISCANPSQNTQGNTTILLTGELKPATAPYGKVLDVDHITNAAAFPLTIFKTTIKKGNYVSARCAAADKTWRMKTTWTYNNGKKFTSSKTQKCTVGALAPPSTWLFEPSTDQEGRPTGRPSCISAGGDG
jgi:hypothetical protein